MAETALRKWLSTEVDAQRFINGDERKKKEEGGQQGKGERASSSQAEGREKRGKSRETAKGKSRGVTPSQQGEGASEEREGKQHIGKQERGKHREKSATPSPQGPGSRAATPEHASSSSSQQGKGHDAKGDTKEGRRREQTPSKPCTDAMAARRCALTHVPFISAAALFLI